MANKIYDCIIIGAGPAGLMAAIEASKNCKTLTVEKNTAPGRKLLLTGGRRCNVTNSKSNSDFLDEVGYNKKYLYSTINKFGPQDIYDFFVQNGVPLKEEKDNRIFPISNKASDILNALLKNTKNVEFKYSETVLNIKNGEIKEIITDKNSYKTKNVIVATGGSSFKTTGSSSDNMKFAKTLNQPTMPLFPAETSVFLEEKPDLTGTSFENAKIKFEKKITTGNLIFTHSGFSGEVIMKLSEHIYKSDKKELLIVFIPNISTDEFKDLLNNFDKGKELISFLSILFSRKFGLYLIDKLKINEKIKSLNSQEIDKIINLIKSFPFKIKNVESLEKAYVTGGGIDMKYINCRTMESKINKGIYFVGEALIFMGQLAGVTLHWLF